MRGLQILARRVLPVALCLLPISAAAEVAIRLDPDTGLATVSGLSETEIATLLTTPDVLDFRLDGSVADRGMLLTVSETDGVLTVAPRFPLRSGETYSLRIDLPGKDYSATVAMPASKAPRPTLTSFAPSQAVIPANTLRLYLTFSEPMARGQLRDTVTLRRSDGSLVKSPFLNLETELWDPTQTRATLLLDPGRIKQGVGPNVEAGAPLVPGEAYRISVASGMMSAAGAPLGAETHVTFRAGPPERRAIDPARWQVLSPAAGSQAPLTIIFDRIVDSGAGIRLLQVRDADGRHVRGEIVTDGGGWSLKPDRPWAAGRYQIIVDSSFEDVSGNTPGAPFDTEAGTIGKAEDPVVIAVRITQ